jgi:very-short-patch-repair endonuclease
VTKLDAIPVTTVTRTLFDLAAVAPRAAVFRAFREAEVKRLASAGDLAAALERHRGRRGVATIRVLLNEAGFGQGITRSDLEARFNAFLRRHRLPAPARNVHMRIGALEIEADFVWHEQRVIAELDGRAFHDTGLAFERDRSRDRALAAHGWTVIRVTWRQIRDDAPQLARDLHGLLTSKPRLYAL